MPTPTGPRAIRPAELASSAPPPAAPASPKPRVAQPRAPSYPPPVTASNAPVATVRGRKALPAILAARLPIRKRAEAAVGLAVHEGPERVVAGAHVAQERLVVGDRRRGRPEEVEEGPRPTEEAHGLLQDQAEGDRAAGGAEGAEQVPAGDRPLDVGLDRGLQGLRDVDPAQRFAGRRVGGPDHGQGGADVAREGAGTVVEPTLLGIPVGSRGRGVLG